MVERFVRNEEARGSNPLTSTIPPKAARRRPRDENFSSTAWRVSAFLLKREAHLAEPALQAIP